MFDMVIMHDHLGGYYLAEPEDVELYEQRCDMCGDSDYCVDVIGLGDIHVHNLYEWGQLFYDIYREYGLDITRDYIEHIDKHSYELVTTAINEGLKYTVKMMRDEAEMYEEEFINGRKNKVTE